MDRDDESFFHKYAWLGGLLGALGALYLSSPEHVQVSLRRLAPEAFRASLMGALPMSKWVVVSYATTAIGASWGALSTFFQNSKLKKKKKELVRENEELRFKIESSAIDCYEFFSRFLIGYYSKLSLGSDERVSLYLFDYNRFVCIGRYSANEVYRKRPSKIYKVDQGCISQTWQRNKFQDTSSPDPVSDFESYAKYQEKHFGYKEQQLREMRMKSRSYSGVRIKGPSSDAIAVLIFESTELSGLPIGKIERLINLDEQRRLGALINSLEGHMPSLADAEQEGF